MPMEFWICTHAPAQLAYRQKRKGRITHVSFTSTTLLSKVTHHHTTKTTKLNFRPWLYLRRANKGSVLWHNLEWSVTLQFSSTKRPSQHVHEGELVCEILKPYIYFLSPSEGHCYNHISIEDGPNLLGSSNLLLSLDMEETTDVPTYMYTIVVDEAVDPTMDTEENFFTYFNVTKQGQNWTVELTASLVGLPDYNPESTVLDIRFSCVL